MKIVRCTWDDCEDPKGGWLDFKEIEAFSQEETLVVSVGFLVSKGPKYVTLAADWIDKLKQGGRVTKIPVTQIVKMEDITEE